MEELVLNYNNQAVALMKGLNFQQAFALLQKALKILNSFKSSLPTVKLTSMTYSNLASLYKSTNRIQESTKCLFKVIETEKKSVAFKLNTINAYLNLCSNFSSSNDHESALRYGLTALLLLEKTFPLPDSSVPTLVVAYHNVGVEFEFLKRIDDAVECYKKGWQLAKNRLGLSHTLTISIKNSLVSTSSSIKRLPELSNYRTNSSHACKRSDVIDASVHTNSTTSSAINESRAIATPRYNNNQNRRFMSIDKRISQAKLRIDLKTQRNNEKNAAELIQAWWRGVMVRKLYAEIKLKNQLKKAAEKAKVAVNEFKMIRDEIKRKKNNKSMADAFKQKMVNKGQNLKNIGLEMLSYRKSGNSPVDVKSVNNQIVISKRKNKVRLSISLQQFDKLYLKEVLRLQSWARMIISRRKFLKIKHAALIIQKNVRRYACFKIYQIIKMSIKKIQKVCSNYKA